MICSMTGYASRLFYYNGENYKIEVKTLNHRFLELKFRMPKEWVSIEPAVRALFEKKMKRGSIELWVERASDAKSNGSEIKLNIAQAEKAMELFREVQRKFKITDPICSSFER